MKNCRVASWQTAFGLGFLSSVFDNIPLTALALKQGGYDWGYLAYSVGFGGSMVWFGSSAGVALSNMYPEAKSVGLWLRHGWYIAVAYVIGFFVMLAILGWKPDAEHRKRVELAERDPVVAMIAARTIGDLSSEVAALCELSRCSQLYQHWCKLDPRQETAGACDGHHRKHAAPSRSGFRVNQR